MRSCIFSPSFVSLTGDKRNIEAVWRDFFANPSQWWDYRPEKINPRFPDFKHKLTGEALWLENSRTPSWVEAELAAIPPCSLQSNVVTWARRLKRYVKAGHYAKTLEVFRSMEKKRICLDTRTFLPVLNACAGLGALEEGKRVHTHITQVGCDKNVYVATCLVDMYAKCGSIEDAWSVFHKMREHDLVSWNAMIGACVKCGQGLKAMELFKNMQQERVEPNLITFLGVLNACASVAAIEEGRRVHVQIIERGYDFNVTVANCLIDMYAKCGGMEDAFCVFNKMRERDVVSWSTIIGSYVKSGHGVKALELFQRMQEEGVDPNAVTFVGVLNACASVAALEEGRRVHQQIIHRGWEADVYVGNCLIDMYAKCGSMEDAWSVFNKSRKHDVVSWNAMIGGYVKSEKGLKAMELFRIMEQEGVEPSPVSFLQLLNACGNEAALEEGRRAHEQIVQRGCESDLYVANGLVDMYGKCGSIEDAWSVFSEMRERNVVSWGAMIGGYLKSGQALKAMELFHKMQQEGVEPDAVIFASAVNACASLAALEEGRCVHEQIISRGYESDDYVASCLVDMYSKFGSIEDAQSVFNKMGDHDLVSWNAMIGVYLKFGQGLKAIELFQNMQYEGVEPDAVTFVQVLKACASVAALEEGRRVHEQIIQGGYESNNCVATCLVDMYIKCESIDNAWSEFNKMRQHDVVSWSGMIGGYVRSGQGLKAIELFRKMRQAGVEPNTVTFLGVLNACAIVAALEEGRCVHEQIIQSGYESDVYVATCLVDMYAKCGSIEDAWSVFNKMQERDIVCWNTMIGGYAMQGHAKKAVGLFKGMGRTGIEIDGITFTCLLSACSHVGLVKEGLRYFKSMTSCFNILPTMEHYVCMVDLLGRANQLEEAEEMTKRMPAERNAPVWMSLLGACRIHGNIQMAERAAKQCWELDAGNASGHVLLSNIYAAAGSRIGE